MKKQIQELEERIRQAQLANDVQALEELISDQLQFIFLDGSVVGKTADLEAHRRKLVRFQSITFTEQVIETWENVSTVTVKAEIQAIVGGEMLQNTCRYGRTWAKINGQWKLISGNVTIISGDKH